MTHFRPDFSRGVGPAADQQILLADCLQRRFEEAEARKRAAFERICAMNGEMVVGSEVEINDHLLGEYDLGHGRRQSFVRPT